MGTVRSFAGRRHRKVMAVVAAALTTGSLLAPAMADPAGAVPVELFISEYIEGSSNNKAIEIYNGTGGAIDLGTGGYNLQMYFNGSATAGLTVNLTGSVASGDVFVIAQASASATVLAQADQTNGAGWFNGDDAVVLRRGTTVVDVFGQIGFDPGTEWGTGVVSTNDNTLRRKDSIETGDISGADAFVPSTEWDGFAIDSFGGLGCHPAPTCPDIAPSVTTTTPASGAVDVARAASVSITFSEAVTLTHPAFSVTCAASGVHAVTVSGGPSTFTVDPSTDFAANELCTVVVTAANVTDQDTTDPPDTMAADVTFSFTTASTVACGDASTPINAVQGLGSTSPLVGTIVSIEGVVTADYQAAGQFGGYYVQSPTATTDADPLTSEGIFVFNTATPVTVGDAVRVRGTVVEFASSGITLTELSAVSSVIVCSTGNATPPPTPVTLPVTSLAAWEAVEGMTVSIAQDLTVTETFTLARFGDVSLSVNGRLLNPTSIAEPGAPALAQQNLNDRSRILLDDANNQQNIDPTLYPAGGLSASNTLRSGDTVHGLVGLLEQRFGVYRLQPLAAAPPSFDHTNARPATPADVGGTIQVAAFNVLNYFNGNGSGADGAAGGFPTARGAETLAELVRQRDKIVPAIIGLDADVIGLMELENDAAGSSAIEDLVAGLNAATAPGTYSFVDTGVVGTDQIRVGILYRPDSVSPVGSHAVLDSTIDPRFIDTRNRPSIAQTFEDTNGGRFTVVVNHLKSKGSACDDLGDPDTGDGQGNCNLTRTAAAEALVDWVATDPTGSGDADVLVIGDMNAYAREDPIDVFTSNGYVDTIAANLGAGAYSFVFSGQSGYLDHALASPGIAGQITGVTEWHINADEPIALDYNVNFKSPNHVTTLYSADPYRSSDHDPVILGLDLAAPPTVSAGGPYTVVEGGTVVLGATGTDPNGDPLTYEWDLDGDAVFETTGATPTFDATGLVAPVTVSVTVRATDPSGLSATASATVSVLYPFGGFEAPIGGGLSTANAGQAIPVKFSLGGDRGLGILGSGSPTVQQVDCATQAPIGTASPISVIGGGLQYNPTEDGYTLVWRTERSWAGTCRLLTVALVDGSNHTAIFSFG